jgi:hypothetical protein
MPPPYQGSLEFGLRPQNATVGDGAYYGVEVEWRRAAAARHGGGGSRRMKHRNAVRSGGALWLLPQIQKNQNCLKMSKVA